MTRSQSHKSYNAVDYFWLGTIADVFLHKNISAETGEDGNQYYTADEVYLQTILTKEYIESHFDEVWDAAELPKQSPMSIEERVANVEAQQTEIINILSEVLV